jgi:ATP-dependent Clp protease ATP-binding subunit ClpC
VNGSNFTARVRKVLGLARVRAAALQHEYTGIEHLLLALIDEGEGLATAVLENLKVNLTAVEGAVLGMAKMRKAPMTMER